MSQPITRLETVQDTFETTMPLKSYRLSEISNWWPAMMAALLLLVGCVTTLAVVFFDLSRLTRKGITHAIGLLGEWKRVGCGRWRR